MTTGPAAQIAKMEPFTAPSGRLCVPTRGRRSSLAVSLILGDLVTAARLIGASRGARKRAVGKCIEFYCSVGDPLVPKVRAGAWKLLGERPRSPAQQTRWLA